MLSCANVGCECSLCCAICTSYNICCRRKCKGKVEASQGFGGMDLSLYVPTADGYVRAADKWTREPVGVRTFQTSIQRMISAAGQREYRKPGVWLHTGHLTCTAVSYYRTAPCGSACAAPKPWLASGLRSDSRKHGRANSYFIELALTGPVPRPAEADPDRQQLGAGGRAAGQAREAEAPAGRRALHPARLRVPAGRRHARRRRRLLAPGRAGAHARPHTLSERSYCWPAAHEPRRTFD